MCRMCCSRMAEAAATEVVLTEEELLKKYQRCNKCAYKPRLDSKTGSSLPHVCEPDKRATRIEGMRKDLTHGKDPNIFPVGPHKVPRMDQAPRSDTHK